MPSSWLAYAFHIAARKRFSLFSSFWEKEALIVAGNYIFCSAVYLEWFVDGCFLISPFQVMDSKPTPAISVLSELLSLCNGNAHLITDKIMQDTLFSFKVLTTFSFIILLLRWLSLMPAFLYCATQCRHRLPHTELVFISRIHFTICFDTLSTSSPLFAWPRLRRWLHADLLLFFSSLEGPETASPRACWASHFALDIWHTLWWLSTFSIFSRLSLLHRVLHA